MYIFIARFHDQLVFPAVKWPWKLQMNSLHTEGSLIYRDVDILKTLLHIQTDVQYVHMLNSHQPH